MKGWRQGGVGVGLSGWLCFVFLGFLVSLNFILIVWMFILKELLWVELCTPQKDVLKSNPRYL